MSPMYSIPPTSIMFQPCSVSNLRFLTLWPLALPTLLVKNRSSLLVVIFSPRDTRSPTNIRRTCTRGPLPWGDLIADGHGCFSPCPLSSVILSALSMEERRQGLSYCVVLHANSTLLGRQSSFRTHPDQISTWTTMYSCSHLQLLMDRWIESSSLKLCSVLSQISWTLFTKTSVEPVSQQTRHAWIPRGRHAGKYLPQASTPPSSLSQKSSCQGSLS